MIKVNPPTNPQTYMDRRFWENDAKRLDRIEKRRREFPKETVSESIEAVKGDIFA